MIELQTVETEPWRKEPFALQPEPDTPDLQTFARVHFEFATWHPQITFDAIEIAVRKEGRFTARGRVVARSPQLGTIECGATGRDRLDAIQHVASLLEIEVNRRLAARERPPTAALRNRPGWRKILPPQAIPAPTQPAPALWSAR